MATPENTNDGSPFIGDGNGERSREEERELAHQKQKLETSLLSSPFVEKSVAAPSTSREKQKPMNPKPQQPQTQTQSKNRMNNNNNNKKRKRIVCGRCHRPKPQTCLCHSLPESAIALNHCEVVVLQHPLELKNHKAASHRSLPLLELCLSSESLVSKVGRRFGPESLGPEILSKLWGDSDSDCDCEQNGEQQNCEFDTAEDVSYLPVLVFPKIQVGAAVEESSSATVTVSVSVSAPCNENNNEKESQKGNGNGNGNENGNGNHQTPWRYKEDESTVLSLRGLCERWKVETTDTIPIEQDPTTDTTTTKTITTDPPPSQSESNSYHTNTSNKHKNNKHNNKKKKKLLLLVLDATWKHAREMHLANIKAHQYPPHMLRLALEPDDFAEGGFVSGRFRLRGKASKTGYSHSASSSNSNSASNDEPQIDEAWMSTAECIAWILSKLEDGGSYSSSSTIGSIGAGETDPEIKGNHNGDGNGDDGENGNSNPAEASTALSLYEILMKPLDAMVAKWNSYRTNSNDNSDNNKKTSSSSSKRKRHRPEFQNTAAAT